MQASPPSQRVAIGLAATPRIGFFIKKFIFLFFMCVWVREGEILKRLGMCGCYKRKF